jgi:putative tryptophan/tyrosine transport system substrate-binding protein
VERRDFIVLFTGVVVAWPLCLQAQQPKKVPRIGYLSTLSSVGSEAFLQGLRELGYVEDTNRLSSIEKLQARSSDSRMWQASWSG